MKFDEMGLREELLRAVADLDYTEPTPIQERAIPPALMGRDLVCCAQTGTGKTAVFALPILHQLAGSGRESLRALVLVPTRELAIQVGRSFHDYGKYLNVVSTTVYGGVPIEPQEMMLRHGVDVLVATPGRLIDHMWRGNIDFRHTQYLVLDEADRMLDMGFIKDVREIVGAVPERRQSMLFSATLDREIQRLAQDILIEPLRIEVAPPATTLDEVDQFLVRADRARKRSTLESLIRDQRMKRTIVFVRTKAGASNLARHLKEHGFKASAMHGDRTQEERVRTLEAFRAGQIHLLVATDIAARGIDIDDISHVVNYDLPYAAGDYVHRIGRTARAGRRGVALSLVTPEDSAEVAAIERLIARRLVWLGEAKNPAPAGERLQGPATPRGRRRPRRTGSGRRASEPPPQVRRRDDPAPRADQAVPEHVPARNDERRPAGILHSVIGRLKTGLLRPVRP